jgi:hypothetical protein
MFVPITGCLNPFAPTLGNSSQSVWTQAQTVGELLDNFRNAYNLRDSLRYSSCLADNFVFYYYDVENERNDQWGRDTDLKATGGLFRNFDDVTLTWYGIADTISDFSQEGLEKEFDISFNLSLFRSVGNAAYDLYGLAHFTVSKAPGGKFRIVSWKDNTVF